MSIEIEVSRNIRGSQVVLKQKADDLSKASALVTEMNSLLDQVHGTSAVKSHASESEAASFPLGINPAPALDNSIPELPVLENAPQSYKPSDATVEILNPEKSLWARKQRYVSEIQSRLQECGVRGISDIATFDSIVRALQAKGVLGREKLDGKKYAYYLKVA